MRLSPWFALLAMAMLILGAGCSSDDSPTPPETPDPPMNEALEDYWSTNTDMTSAMVSLTTRMDEIEVAIGNLGTNKSTIADIDALVAQFYNESLAAAAHFDVLIGLEDSIHGYGSEKGMFTDLVSGVVKGVYNVTKKVVVSSGQMVRTSWRVLSGSHSLRQALRATDSGIPIVSDMAVTLQKHNAQRDEAVIASILAGNSQEGFIPLDSLQGSTPEERANYYRNLQDEDPLKMTIRTDTQVWHDGERAAVAVTMKKAGVDGVKTYVGAIGGSDELVEIGDQLLSPNQSSADKATVSPLIKKETDATLVSTPKTMIIHKRNQPEDKPKVVILEGIDPDFDVELPTGAYDIIVIAEDYIRSAEVELEVAAAETAAFLLEMYEYAGNSVILESVTAYPLIGIVNDPITVKAVAATIIGGSLSFAWEITGGTFTGFSSTGSTCTFVPTESGDFLASVTVTGSAGEPKTGSATIPVSMTDIQVESFDFTSEQFSDDVPNPGELLTISAVVVNGTDSEISGAASLVGTGLIVVSTGSYPSLTVPANGSTIITAQIQLPVNYSRDQGVVEFHFLGTDVEIIQDLEFDVDFFVELNAITSPVTDRVLLISGRVANPSLTSAHLALDGDLDQVFQVNLVNGVFSQNVAMEASSEETSHHAVLSADSGNWHEEDDLSFTAQVDPAGFRVTLAWDTGGTDVDLWVTDPSSETCDWTNTSTASGLSLDFDDTDGYGPENITNETPPPGAYVVQAHYYSDHDDDAAIGTSCTIVIRLNEGTEDEEVYNYYGFLGDTGAMWSVTTITLGDKGLFEIVEDGHMGFVDPGTLPAK